MRLTTPFGATEILVRAGLVRSCGAHVAGALAGPRAASIVTDRCVLRAGHARQVERSLRKAGFTVRACVILPSGERAKAFRRVAGIVEHLAGRHHERFDPVVAVGGGSVCDAAGFAAAIYMRGVPLVLVPTTLLAMADAAIGGKTAADLPQGKNLAGAFHAARLVLCDPEALASLPPRAYAAGLAEILKCAVVGDAHLFRFLERNADAVLKREPAALAYAVRAAAAVKIRLVEADPYDTRGWRALLNYGHTIGHAVEAASGFRGRSHGEAVAIGMEAEARIAEAMGIANGVRERQAALLDWWGLPRTAPELVPGRIVSALRHDKKVDRGRIRFALPVRIGAARFPVVAPERLCKEAIRHVARG